MMQPDVREYEVRAGSTATFGRVLCNARQHHFVVDGPVQNGCPGEALTPPELFLSSIAACGVELLQVIARQRAIPLREVAVTVHGVIDRSRPVRPDVSLFNTVRLRFRLSGVSAAEGAELVEGFKGR